ncbi:MAG: ankyrin repeat domain-containing protein [Pseudomonadota bacterium]|nr:ankyrin repeat domain-containing protein [Pseudomonadota bacterium]
MTPEDSAHDKELLERYRRASDTKPTAPSEAVRAAILAEGRRVAEQRAIATSQQPFDVSRRAANDSRWKITALGTAGAALVAAMLFAPNIWEHGPRLAQTINAPQTGNAPAGPAVASEPQSPTSQAQLRNEFPAPAASANAAAKAAPKAESVRPAQQDRQSSLAEMAPAEKARSRKPGEFAQSAVETAPASADNASAARSAPLAESAAGFDQSEVSANRLQSARTHAAAERSGLLSAAASGDSLKIQVLMDQGAALDERDKQGRTPLMLAVINGRREAVGLLLARGADPNAADHSGRTPLQMARQANSREIAALLERSRARQDVGR